MASDGSDPDAEYALFRLLQRDTMSEYQNEFEMLISRVTGKSDSLLASIYIFGQRALLWSNPTTLGGSKNKTSDSSTTPEVAHEVATKVASYALRETTTAADTVAKIEETGEFYTSESEASTFEELKQQISTKPVLSLSDLNEVFVGLRMSLAATYQKEVVTKWPEEFQEGQSLEKSMAICDSRVVFLKTAMQRRLWHPGIKSAFQDDTMRARWFRKSEECYALSLG
nr:hypothetical protein [Tanacetum cinerariifolium]